MLNLNDGNACFEIESESLGIILCLVLDNITFRIIFDGENPFDTNGFSARRKLDRAPGRAPRISLFIASIHRSLLGH